MRKLRCAVFAAVLVGSPEGVAVAQTTGVGFAKGDSVVMVVPTRYASVTHTGLGGLNTKFDIKAHMSAGVVEVRDPDDSSWHRDWRFGGFPSGVHFLVSNLKTVSRPDDSTGDDRRYIEVTLRIERGFDYRLYAPVEQPEAVHSLLAPASAADSVMALAYDSLGSRFFTGPLAGFSADERKLLMTFAHITASGTRIGSETFKGITYLTVTLPTDGNVWNDLRVTRTERMGRVISTQLALLKAFARITIRHDLIGGLKLTQPSSHGTAPNYLDTRTDQIEAYFPVDLMVKFADADITSQQLVNQSIILVSGDRVEVNLGVQ